MISANDNLSFYEHCDEFRRRVIYSLVAVMLAGVIVYSQVDKILKIIVEPAGSLVFTAPADAFLAQIILAFFTGIFLALPFILYEVWQFVASGLEENEKRLVFFFGPVSLFLFLIGAVFAYNVVIPVAIKFFLGFSSEIIRPMITIKSYISFVGTMLLGFGVVFELPLVIMFLTKIGVATPQFLEENRKFSVVIILCISALMTPPDVITQLIMAGPLVLLYEAGIMVSKLTARRSS